MVAQIENVREKVIELEKGKQHAKFIEDSASAVTWNFLNTQHAESTLIASM
jgi:hypothetical protein